MPSWNQFLTLHNYINSEIKLIATGSIALAAMLAFYKAMELSGFSNTTSTLGVVIVTAGFFIKRPLENFIARCVEYHSLVDDIDLELTMPACTIR